MLHLYDTLTRRKRLFEPLISGHVSLYVCGITVYDVCHIGHARSMIVYDVMCRHLRSVGYSVNYVRNITDVDDKIIKRALDTQETPLAIAERYIEEMRADERALNVLPPDHEPRATETIEGMVELITQLIDKGHAYPAANGDVYFSVKSFADYGKLSGRKTDELIAGERIAIDEHKRDPLDFVVWKSSKAHEPSWPSPWGAGRPGWHIECSAMSRELLGEEFDIHGGGIDLEFPHHENEIAQSEALTDGRFARYWVHNGLIRVDDVKMSKSLNNFLTIKDALEAYSGEELRTFVLGSLYRSPVNYTTEAMDAARTVLRRFYTALRGIELTQNPTSESLDSSFVERYEQAMNDDLNTPEALAVMHELASELNRESGTARKQVLANTLSSLGQRMGILENDAESALQGTVPGVESQSSLSSEQINDLIEQRNEARLQKDFQRSDRIRDELAEAGVVLEDANGKTTWRRQQ